MPGIMISSSTKSGVAFSLNRVDAVLSWRSLLQGRLVMSLLAIERPVLHVRREADGRITVAGIDAEGSEIGFHAELLLISGLRIGFKRFENPDEIDRIPGLKRMTRFLIPNGVVSSTAI